MDKTYYVVWQHDLSSDLDQRIIKIYKSQSEAVSKMKKFVKEFDKKDIRNFNSNMLESLGHTSDNLTPYYCTEISLDVDLKQSNGLYVLLIMQDSCSYSAERSYYVFESLEGAIDQSVSYFEEEHNRDEECEKCNDGSEICLKIFKKDLTNYLGAYIEGTDFCYSCEIAPLKISISI